MDLYQKTSKAVKVGEVYNLEHFDKAWANQSLRRLMGNELVYPPSPKVVQAVKDILDKANYYPEDITTDRMLRERLADYVDLKGKADWITVGNGSMEIIDMLYKAFLDDGDELLLPTPDYSPYSRRAPLYGAKVVDVLPVEDFTYTLESFTRLLTPKTKMIFASRPNNPTGHSLKREVVTGLCETGRIVVIDEAYVEFSNDPAEDLLEKYPNLIISHTFSKAMGLAGVRLGFIVTNPEIIGYINRIRTPLNISLLAHVAGIAAVDDRAYIQANAKKVMEDREYLYQEVKKIPGLYPYPSTGNFVLINCKDSGFTATDFYERFLEAGYLVRSFVNGRGLPGNQFFRITIGTRQDVEGCLAVIRSMDKAR